MYDFKKEANMPTAKTATKPVAKPDTVGLSIPKARMVRGYEIKRLPLGGYLKALDAAQTLPGELMAALLPGETMATLPLRLGLMDQDDMARLAARALALLPGKVLPLLADLTGIPMDRMTDDPELGLDGLMEVLTAFVQVNGLTNFPAAVRGLTTALRTAR
jgi:hypothetical protein